jgi:hypothetical protein
MKYFDQRKRARLFLSAARLATLAAVNQVSTDVGDITDAVGAFFDHLHGDPLLVAWHGLALGVKLLAFIGSVRQIRKQSRNR